MKKVAVVVPVTSVEVEETGPKYALTNFHHFVTKLSVRWMYA